LATTTYTQGRWQFVYSARYIGRAALFSRDPTSADHSENTNIPYANAKFYHNIAVHYNFDTKWTKSAEVYAGINNLFGDLPPFVTIGQGTDLGYDLGRYSFAGVKFKQ
jgi:hypothetical protein